MMILYQLIIPMNSSVGEIKSLLITFQPCTIKNANQYFLESMILKCLSFVQIHAFLSQTF